MLVKIKAMIFIIGLLFSFIGVQVNIAQSTSDADKIRAKVIKYGVGKKVTVTNIFDEKFKGKISKIEKDSFTVTNSKSGKSETFKFDKISKVKKKSYAKWIAIGIVAGAGILAIITLNRRCRAEGNTSLCL